SLAEEQRYAPSGGDLAALLRSNLVTGSSAPGEAGRVQPILRSVVVGTAGFLFGRVMAYGPWLFRTRSSSLVVDTRPGMRVSHEARVLGDKVSQRRQAREDRLRALGYEEPSDDTRRDQLNLNVALREWPKR